MQELGLHMPFTSTHHSVSYLWLCINQPHLPTWPETLCYERSHFLTGAGERPLRTQRQLPVPRPPTPRGRHDGEFVVSAEATVRKPWHGHQARTCTSFFSLLLWCIPPTRLALPLSVVALLLIHLIHVSKVKMFI